MKRTLILLTGICLALTSLAQEDTTKQESDTLRIGSMIIIKKGGDNDPEVRISNRRSYRPSPISTNWGIVDIGFANYEDKTDYSSTDAQAFAPGSTRDWFKVRQGKSVNVNIWIFMQRLNIYKNVVNLKYGLGVELNNYRYTNRVRYLTDPKTMVIMDTSTTYEKNKLAADYVTIPMMLNFNFTPDRKNGFGLSIGASAGYLYNARQKTITAAHGKEKNHDDFDLRDWKISYIAELQLGPVKLYGSLATQSMFERGLDQVPYNVGIRFSNW